MKKQKTKYPLHLDSGQIYSFKNLISKFFFSLFFRLHCYFSFFISILGMKAQIQGEFQVFSNNNWMPFSFYKIPKRNTKFYSLLNKMYLDLSSI